MLAVLSLVLSLAAAAPPAAAPPPTGTESQYLLGRGDVLQVRVYGEEGLSGAFPVNDSGELEFPLLGAVGVSGRTAGQVAELVRERLSRGFIVEPEVTAWVEAYGSQPVQVLGAVEKPGVYYVRGPTTLLQVLSLAGGVSAEGVNEVRITRGEGNVTVLPYEALVAEGSGNAPVAGGDVVYVPQSLVYVQGQVEKPGPVPFRENLTVTRCLAAVGGAAPEANLRKVWILRGDERIRVNVRRILQGKEADVVVRDGDQVFVSESVF